MSNIAQLVRSLWKTYKHYRDWEYLQRVSPETPPLFELQVFDQVTGYIETNIVHEEDKASMQEMYEREGYLVEIKPIKILRI